MSKIKKPVQCGGLLTIAIIGGLAYWWGTNKAVPQPEKPPVVKEK